MTCLHNCTHLTEDQRRACIANVLDCPHAMRNTPGGMRHLQKWHSRFNANHPARIKEREDAAARAASLRAPAPVETGPREKPYPKKRVKRPTPKADPDGKFRL